MRAGEQGVRAGEQGVRAGEHGVHAGEQGVHAGEQGVHAGEHGVPASVQFVLHAWVQMYVHIRAQTTRTNKGLQAHAYSETSVIRHRYNPTFSLIRPSYEVQSPP